MMRNPTTEYQVVNAYQELEQDPEIELVSGGGPITKEDRKNNGVEKTEELIISRYWLLNLLTLNVFKWCIFLNGSTGFGNC
jgi:hypothetical protein